MDSYSLETTSSNIPPKAVHFHSNLFLFSLSLFGFHSFHDLSFPPQLSPLPWFFITQTFLLFFLPFLHSRFLSPSPSMAMNTNTSCLISTMDHLWYHHIILWSDPLSSHVPNFVSTTTFPVTKFLSSPSPFPLPLSPLMGQTIIPPSLSSPSVSSDNISLLSQQEDYSIDKDEDKRDGKKQPSDESLDNLKFSVGRKMNKSISCKSLGELELEEVKGFMDLGFEFKSENLSPQMVKLLPGLQRLRTQISKQNLEDDEGEDCCENDDEENDDDDKKRDTARPYLSEAWTIKRPNSPLLNLRMPKVSSTSDMKKHLKSWAKTVACEIQ